MKLELISERLLLRPLAESDLDVGIAILTDPEVMKFIGPTQTKDRVVRELPIAQKRGGGGCIGVAQRSCSLGLFAKQKRTPRRGIAVAAMGASARAYESTAQAVP